MRRAALLLMIATSASGAARAGEAAAPQVITMSAGEALDAAAALIGRGHLTQADAVLRTLASAPPGRIDAARLDTLAAVIAQARGEHDRAVRILSRVLDHDPDLAVARFHLAESLFALRQDRRAAYHYRLAGPGLAPPDARQAILRLRAIQDRRVLTVSLRAAVVPDTNLNTATDEARQVIGGIEQTLNDDGALARSGVGLSASLDVAATPKLRGALRAEGRLTAQVQEQEGARFDYARAGIEAGPRWQGERVTASLLATHARDAYGGEAVSESTGAVFRLGAPLTQRLRTGATLSATHRDHRRDGLDGWTYAGALSAQRAVGGRSLVGGHATAARTHAASAAQSAWRAGGGLFASREVVGGVTLSAAPALYWRTADAAAPGQERREDVTLTGTVSATKRRLAVGGVAPVVSYAYTRNLSTVGLYAYERHRLDVGLTSRF